MSAYDFVYSKLKAEEKSFSKMMQRRIRERGPLTAEDATNPHAAVSYWEGKLETVREIVSYFDQIREAERLKR